MNRICYPFPLYPLVGDVVSAVGAQDVRVVGLQGIPLDVSQPLQDGAMLVYNLSAGHWQPVFPILFETNSTPNGDQRKLNLIPGSHISILDDGMGNITIDYVP